MVLQQSLADLNTAYRNFFASVKGSRKGRKVGPPRFRSARTAAVHPVHRQRPVQGHRRAGGCGCPRSATCRCAGRGSCRPSRRQRDRDQGRGRAVLRRFVWSARPRPASRRRTRGRIDLGLTALRGPVRRAQDRQPAVPAPGGEEAQQGAASPGRKEKGSRTGRRPGQGRPARTPGSPNPPGLLHKASTRSSATTKRCTWRTCAWPGWPDPAGQIRARRRAGPRSRRCWNTRPAGTGASSPGPAGSSRPPGVLGMRSQGRPQAAQCPRMDMRRVRDGPRPGRQRGPEHARPGTEGEPKRLRRPVRPAPVWHRPVKQEASEVPHERHGLNPQPARLGARYSEAGRTNGEVAAAGHDSLR